MQFNNYDVCFSQHTGFCSFMNDSVDIILSRNSMSTNIQFDSLINQNIDTNQNCLTCIPQTVTPIACSDTIKNDFYNFLTIGSRSDKRCNFFKVKQNSRL